MSDGVATYVCVHDNGPTLEPHFNETWDLLPSALPTEQVAALEDLAVNSVLAMGFTMGVFCDLSVQSNNQILYMQLSIDGSREYKVGEPSRKTVLGAGDTFTLRN
mmetsp:Transcript_15407/g.12848  ORF Transcript_15407/g.12848 Transcript_15407/m.12848 type:complete len:105 (+) Transcript_15407:782-1096(+)